MEYLSPQCIRLSTPQPVASNRREDTRRGRFLAYWVIRTVVVVRRLCVILFADAHIHEASTAHQDRYRDQETDPAAGTLAILLLDD